MKITVVYEMDEGDAQHMLEGVKTRLVMGNQGSIVACCQGDAMEERDDARAEVERRKGYAETWEKTANDALRSRAVMLKKMANGYQVTVLKLPITMDVLKQLVPCECFQLDQEMVVVHKPTAPF